MLEGKWASTRENLSFGSLQTTKAQTSLRNPRRLISILVFCLLQEKISIFLLISVTEHAGLSIALSEIPKTGFVTTRPIYWSRVYKEDNNRNPLLNYFYPIF